MRFRRLGIIAASCIFAAFVVVGSFAPLGSYSVLFDQVQDAGHVVVFTVITVGLFAIGRYRNIATWRNYTVAVFVSAGLGILIEVVQAGLPDRNASFGDLVRDLLGIITGVFLIAAWTSRVADSRRRQVLFVTAAMGAFVWGVYPVIDCIGSLRLRQRVFPVIVSSDAIWWHRFLALSACEWQIVEPSAPWPGDSDGRVLEIVLKPMEPYPGFGLREVASNWSAASELCFDVFSQQSEPIELVIRVHDRYHERHGNDDYFDRFNRKLTIRPGFQTICIPVSQIAAGPKRRSLDLSQIRGVYLYAEKPNQTIRFQFDNLRLRLKER